MRVLVFDSGIGGVSVAREVRRVLPGAAVTYLMDDAGFPYGGRDDAWLLARVLGIVGAGIGRVAPDLVVVACNTASTVALAGLRARFGLPFVGCVPPVKVAAGLSRTRVIGVLATPATVRGPYLRALCERVAPGVRVLVHGAAGLAGLAEARFAGVALGAGDVAGELAGLLGQDGAGEMDAVALGCTHYGWLLAELRACLPCDVAWLDPAAAVAGQVLRVAGGVGAGGVGAGGVGAGGVGAGVDGGGDGVVERAGDAGVRLRSVGGGAVLRGGEDGLVLRTGDGGLVGEGWAAAGFGRVARVVWR